MNILFYVPYNQSVNYIESVAEAYSKQGHSIFLLTHEPFGPLHQKFQLFNASAEAFGTIASIFPFKQIGLLRLLVKYCNKWDIKLVYSHYQEANLIAVFCQYFLSTRVIITRHHTDSAFVDDNWKERMADRIINKLARYYIAPSKMVYNQILAEEGKVAKNVFQINYGYHFSKLPATNAEAIQEIKKQYACDILLIEGARFIIEKRHGQLIESIRELVDNKYNIKLLLIGKGPEEQFIERKITELKLENHVYNLGFKPNPMNFYAAADLFVHFSISEASNSAVKEAALCGTPAAVCTDVGDFNDYIQNNINGYLLSKKNPKSDFIKVIHKFDRSQSFRLGEKLKQKVVERFSIDRVFPLYNQFHEFTK